MILVKNIFIFGGFHIFHVNTHHKREFKVQKMFKHFYIKTLLTV